MTEKLPFNHILSKIAIITQAGNGLAAQELTNACLSIEGIYEKALLSLSDAYLQAGGTETSRLAHTEGCYSEVWLLPLPSPNAHVVIHLHNGKTLRAPLPNANFVSGLHYYYHALVHQDGIDLYPIHTAARQEEDEPSLQALNPDDISYQIGDYFPHPRNPDTAIGIVYWLRPGSWGRSGKILSLDSAEKAWSVNNIKTIHALSIFSGHINLNAVLATDPTQQSFPAFHSCALKGPGWHLPSQHELQVLYDQWDQHAESMNQAIVAAQGRPISKDDSYWSSSESGERPSGTAVACHFGSGIFSSEDKNSLQKVRAIKVFF